MVFVLPCYICIYMLPCHKIANAFATNFKNACSPNNEPVLLQLINAHCKPFLLYGMETVNLSNRELNTLNYTYSNGICKIFKVSHCSVEDILHFTQYQGLLDVKKDTTCPKRPNC